MKMKKIIAREFLVFLSAIILISFSYFGWIQIEKNINEEINESQVEVDDVFKFEPVISLDLITKEYNRNEIYRYNITTLDDGFVKKYSELSKYNLQPIKDFIRTKNDNKYKSKLVFYSKFPEFGFDVNGRHKNISDADFEKVKANEQRINQLENSFFVTVHYDDRGPFLALTYFSILFFARYLFYAVKWSIIQLKEK
jgi:hypothetical protein